MGLAYATCILSVGMWPATTSCMALLNSMVRKLQICHRRTFSPRFNVVQLSFVRHIA